MAADDAAQLADVALHGFRCEGVACAVKHLDDHVDDVRRAAGAERVDQHGNKIVEHIVGKQLRCDELADDVLQRQVGVGRQTELDQQTGFVRFGCRVVHCEQLILEQVQDRADQIVKVVDRRRGLHAGDLGDEFILAGVRVFVEDALVFGKHFVKRAVAGVFIEFIVGFAFNIGKNDFRTALDLVAGEQVNDQIDQRFRIVEDVGEDFVQNVVFIVFVGDVFTEQVADHFHDRRVFLDEGDKEHQNFRLADGDLTLAVDLDKIVHVAGVAGDGADRCGFIQIRIGVADGGNALDECAQGVCTQRSSFVLQRGCLRSVSFRSSGKLRFRFGFCILIKEEDKAVVVIGGVVFRRILRFQDTGQVEFKRAEQAEDRLREVRLEAVHIVGFNFAGCFVVFNLRLQQVLDRFPADLFVAAHHGDDAFEHSGKNFVNLQGDDTGSGIFRARNVPADDVGQGGDRDQQVLNQCGQTVCIQEVCQRRQRLGQRCDRERGNDFNETEHVVRDILDTGFHAAFVVVGHLTVQQLLIIFSTQQVGLDLLVAGSAGNAVDVFQHGLAGGLRSVGGVRIDVVQNLLQTKRVEQRDKDVRVAVHALDAQCTRIVRVGRILEQNQILTCEQGCKDVLQRGDHQPDVVQEAVLLRQELLFVGTAGDAVKVPAPVRGGFLVDLYGQLVFVVAGFQLRFGRANDRIAGLFAVFILQDDERL